jgi:putative ABC transport system permease protein
VQDLLSEQGARTLTAAVILLAVTFGLRTLARIRQRSDLVVSSARAAVQLTVVALVIAWIFAHPQGAAAYLVVMLAAATITAVRRIGCGYRESGGILLAIFAGAGATVLVVAVTGALARDVQTLLPFAAQMIGGAMTAALLAGSRLRDDALNRWDEVEGRLALGARPRQAVRPMSRHSVEQALSPALDQTKSAGLVLLPGSFVGLLLGGASPLTAMQIQVLVLFGLLLAQMIAAWVTTSYLATSVGSLKPTAWLPAARG